ncbi:pyridoxal phosphate-dependent aminotransferase [Coralliovum pocilloporae]|uniref:pyridoxal phosphate-dependent aminotransferase n=1 Tax=Coralliovum pocilloporae TaxID=3066369 RepID=UPI003306C6F7
MSSIARSLDRFKPSPISEIYSRAARLKEEGRRIIDLSIGEPDFDIPEPVKEAGIRAIRDGLNTYTALEGMTAFRAAVSRKFKRDNNLDYTPDQIMADAGLKPLLFHCLQAVINPGDEVIIPTPAWTSYMGMAALAGAEAVLVPCREENGFRLTPDDLDRAITPKSKVLFLNSPSNPTGAAYDEAALKELAHVLLKHPHVLVFADDIYEHIVYDGFRFRTLAEVEPRLYERVLTLNGLSKAYSMTGWRLGYVGGPAYLIAAVRKVMSQNTGSPPTPAQYAGMEALDGPQGELQRRAAIFKTRRDLLIDGLSGIPGLRPNRPEGAFYLYPNCDGLLGRETPGGKTLTTSTDLAAYLLEEAGVALVPGSGFEYDPYLRFSYAASEDDLRAAVTAIASAVEQLR